MKVSWAPDDIFCGLRVGRDGDKIGKGMIVGYDPGHRTTNKLCLISLDDGMLVCGHQTPKQIAEWLTRNNELPVEVLGRRKSERNDEV